MVIRWLRNPSDLTLKQTQCQNIHNTEMLSNGDIVKFNIKTIYLQSQLQSSELRA